MNYSNLGFIFCSSRHNKKHEQTAELLLTVCLCFSSRFQQLTWWAQCYYNWYYRWPWWPEQWQLNSSCNKVYVHWPTFSFLLAFVDNIAVFSGASSPTTFNQWSSEKLQAAGMCWNTHLLMCKHQIQTHQSATLETLLHSATSGQKLYMPPFLFFIITSLPQEMKALSAN